ncbi:hypothetical protein PHYBOEH_002336 [Phytophthora boehmeriae]|uniref:DOCKER domain-containing protein n=1 Tax=Phytophthora boehmeriae TaxID=109152 RepID=A0A8T1WSE4_9STRA|nr:hypothetical protein PHYBOEH_002336 [Phytophthora boehmeriae]
MRTFATTSRGSVLSVPLHFHTQFIELINDLTAKVHAYERWRDAFESPDGAHDFEEIEEGIDRVVDDISRHWLLEEKLVWLNALMRLHVRRDRFAEAACCKIAAIKYVQLGGSNTLVRVQQWVVQELLLARNYAKQADWIDKELAICEQLLVRLKQQQRFREYQETLQYVNTVINRFAERQEGGSQYVSSVFSFYRVQYAGGCVSARIARDEYIYKRSKFMSLGEFVSETKTMLRAKYPQCERVDVIPEPKPLVGNETNPYVIFLRVTTVEEASTGELVLLKMPERRGLSWFKFAVPFALGSSTSYGKTSEQMKRITYLSVERTFPCRLSRQRVLMRHEVLRCPIDNSMDDIRKRCSLLRIELDNERVGKTDLKSLTLVLKGSVDTHVHGGIPEILDSFLVADPTNLFDVHGHGMSSHDSLQKRHELANLLVEFANLCWQCLRVSREAFNRSNHPNPSQLHLPLPPNHSRHAEPSSSQPENKKPDGSFLPPLSDELASFATIDKLAMSPTALPVDTESSQPLIEVSPLQTEFERSFAALVEQIRSKIAFAYRNAPDLERLYQQTMRLRTKQLPVSPPPAPTILTNMNTPAAVSPLPTQNTLPSPPAPTLSSNSAE